MAGKEITKINDSVLFRIGELADQLKVQAYIVGGYVRDLILGLDSKDIDVVVIGDPISFAKEVQRKLGATAFVLFEKFRTAQMMIDDVKVEIVGARSESYDASSRKPRKSEKRLLKKICRGETSQSMPWRYL